MPPRIKFDELITIDDWSGALRKILDAAVKATENRDAQGRQDLMDLLLTFIKRSPAKVEYWTSSRERQSTISRWRKSR